MHPFTPHSKLVSFYLLTNPPYDCVLEESATERYELFIFRHSLAVGGGAHADVREGRVRATGQGTPHVGAQRHGAD